MCVCKINPLGFIETPYRKVEEGKINYKVDPIFLSAEEEENKIIAQASTIIADDGQFVNEKVKVRYQADYPITPREEVGLIDIAPNQIASIAASLIPFLEHDDANRALMGSNMQRQAVPLLETEAPLVGTGMEARVAKDSGAVLVAERDGIVKELQADKIVVGDKEYELKKFERSNASTCINQRPIVKPWSKS